MTKILFLSNGSKLAKQVEESLLDSLYITNRNGEKFTFYGQPYDIGISFLYTYLVPKEQLTKPWINFHPGPLPNFGGRNLIYHAIKEKSPYFGATIHYMDEGFDSGPIIEVLSFPISMYDTAEAIKNLTDLALYKLFIKYIGDLKQGKLPPNYPNVGLTYYKQMKINDYIEVEREQKNDILAKYCPPFYPKIKIGERTFKIVEDV